MMTSNVSNSLLNSQLENLSLRNSIAVKVADKTLDAAKTQGEAVLKLLEEAVETARQPGDGQPMSLGAKVSGLGRQLDVRA